jgi:glycosyltransferase involved in cell wall biosynthesis
MKILLLCYEFPSPQIAGSHRVLHCLKYLSGKYKHDITLVAFKLPGRNYPDLSRYCHIETVETRQRPGLKSPATILAALKSTISAFNIFSKYAFFLNWSYSPEMDEKIKTLLADNRYDIIVVDHPAMLRYVPDKKSPVVLLEAFAIAGILRMEYTLEKNGLKKALRLLYYHRTINYAAIYQAVDTAIGVSSEQRNIVKSDCPDLNVEIILHGIDAEYFKSVESETDYPSLIITGSMGSVRNKAMVLYFYDEIYPLIKKSIPNLKLFIVGNNPGKEIIRLAADSSVIVTGYVEDLRPYLSRAWVVVAPLQEGFGVKVRVLQAMAVGKPVVATSMVRSGIDVTPGENIMIADEPQDFANKVIELLNNRELRLKIGGNARHLMQNEHDWEKLTYQLNEVLEKAVREHGR